MKPRLRLYIVLLFSTLTASVQAQHQPNRLAPSNEPLIRAIRDGELATARKMIKSGTRLNIADECWAIPLHEAIRWSDRDGYIELVLELLAAGADPKYPDGGAGALIGAAYMCSIRIARELLKRGVSVNTPDGRGVTALMEAPSQRCADGAMVQLLLDAGANPNAKDNNGYNALLAAAMTGDAAGAEKLLKAGADPAFKNKYGDTAESESCDRGEQGHYRVCQLVREALRKQ